MADADVEEISTRAPRTGSDLPPLLRWGWRLISTRAPRTGSDAVADIVQSLCVDISTRAPRTGSDDSGRWQFSRLPPFQPALPARGATGGEQGERLSFAISTRAPRTGSDQFVAIFRERGNLISTRAPRTGSDKVFKSS